MIFRAQHLNDDRLFDRYLAARNSEPADPRVAEHLADCDGCATRYAELVTVMNELRVDADEAVDALFTPEHLRAQQQQIARRIEHVGHAARVISFPHARAAERHDRPWLSMPRFAAAAAAAGLFIGLALGASVGWPWHREGPVTQDVPRPTPAQAALDTNLPSEKSADDLFFSDLEMMLDRPRTGELQSFEALTPRARDVVLNYR